MKILNVMLCKKLGGIQQVFLDYDEILRSQKHEVLNIVHTKAKIIEKLRFTEAYFCGLFNLSKYDFFADKRFAKIIADFQPDIIILHGNRATTICKRTLKRNNIKIPAVGVCHNKRIKGLIGLDALFIILESLRKVTLELGQKPRTNYYMPNVIKSDLNQKFESYKYNKPPMIGFMGRLSAEKGVDCLLKALNILKRKKNRI